jgi:hypothetical protein
VGKAIKSTYKFLDENLKGRDHFRDLGLHGEGGDIKTSLKQIV